MLVEILVPRLNANDDECSVATNLVSVGDHVSIGDPLVDLETDKTSFVVESTYDGIVFALPEVGQKATVNSPLVTIKTNGDNNSRITEAQTVEVANQKPDNFTVGAFELAQSFNIDLSIFGEDLVTKNTVQAFLDKSQTTKNTSEDITADSHKYKFIKNYIEPSVAYLSFNFLIKPEQLEEIEFLVMKGLKKWQNKRGSNFKSFVLTKTDETLIPVYVPDSVDSSETFKAELLSQQLNAFRGEKLKQTPEIVLSVLKSDIEFSHTALLWPGSYIVLAIALCNKSMNVKVNITYNHLHFDGNDMLELANTVVV